MLRLLFRFVGLLLLAGAFAAMVVDGTRSIAAGAPAIMPLDRTMTIFSPGSVERLHGFIDKNAPRLWDPLVAKLLALPVWLVLGGFGLVLFALTRRRRPKIGYTRR